MRKLLDFVMKYWLETAFGVIVATHLAKKFKAEKKKNAAIESGLRGILRIQILDTYDRCVADGRTISVSRKDAVVSIYQSYIALGDGESDDTIKALYDELVHMKIV